MSIELSAIAKATHSTLETQQSEPANPEQALADKFSAMMKQGPAETNQVEDLASVVNANAPTYITPEMALEAQSMVAQTVVEVDLAAKTAGSLSQSINKLVNLQ